MPRFPAALLIALCLPALAACGDRTLGERLGMGKRAPDEFAIVRHAPLIMPPDYNLRPPRPGDPGPQERIAGARATLTGQPVAASADAPASPGQRALLQQAGAAEVDPGIRARLAAESGAEAEVTPTLFGRLFSVGGEPLPGDVVDAAAEAERLRTAREAGLSPTEGETPIVVRRSSRAQPTLSPIGGSTTLGTVE